MTSPATIDELRLACPGADSEFLVRMLDTHATTEGARREYIQWQQAELERLRGEAERANQAAAEATAGWFCATVTEVPHNGDKAN